MKVQPNRIQWWFVGWLNIWLQIPCLKGASAEKDTFVEHTCIYFSRLCFWFDHLENGAKDGTNKLRSEWTVRCMILIWFHIFQTISKTFFWLVLRLIFRSGLHKLKHVKSHWPRPMSKYYLQPRESALKLATTTDICYSGTTEN